MKGADFRRRPSDSSPSDDQVLRSILRSASPTFRWALPSSSRAAPFSSWLSSSVRSPTFFCTLPAASFVAPLTWFFRPSVPRSSSIVVSLEWKKLTSLALPSSRQAMCPNPPLSGHGLRHVCTLMQRARNLPSRCSRMTACRWLPAALFATVPFAALGAQDTTRARPLPPLSVTASRTPVSILDVPLAVTIVGGEELRLRRGVGLDEALTLVPGVLAQSRSGGGDVRISIRGFGSRGAGDRSNAGTSRGVRILLDGIPETEPDGRTALDLVDLALVEQMEVVRSNASALYGNVAGCVVDLRTWTF